MWPMTTEGCVHIVFSVTHTVHSNTCHRVIMRLQVFKRQTMQSLLCTCWHNQTTMYFRSHTGCDDNSCTSCIIVGLSKHCTHGHDTSVICYFVVPSITRKCVTSTNQYLVAAWITNYWLLFQSITILLHQSLFCSMLIKHLQTESSLVLGRSSTSVCKSVLCKSRVCTACHIHHEHTTAIMSHSTSRSCCLQVCCSIQVQI